MARALSVGMNTITDCTTWPALSAMRAALNAAQDAHIRLADAHHRADPAAADAARHELHEALVLVLEAWTDVRALSPV